MNGLLEFYCFHRKFLIYNLVQRNLKIRYRKSILGFFWTLLVPAAMALVYFFVFSVVVRVHIDKYLLFVMVGLMPWMFISMAVSASTESLVVNFNILSKVPIAYQAFPLSEVTSGMVNFILSFPVLIALSLLYGNYPAWPWIALPAIYALLFLQTYAISLSLSIAHVYLRDIKHLVGIFIQIWMYLTPIIYNTTLIPEKYRGYFLFNPIYGVIESTHMIFMEARWPTAQLWSQMFLWTIGLTAFSYWLHLRQRLRLVEVI